MSPLLSLGIAFLWGEMSLLVSKAPDIVTSGNIENKSA